MLGEPIDGAAALPDPTLPPVLPWLGGSHPITRVTDDVVAAFERIGFETRDLPLLETVANSFDALGFPADHPVRTRLSFEPTPSVVLRTHATSGVASLLRDAAPDPIRALLVGFCFRNEAPTRYSNFQFLQIDGLVVQPELGLHHAWAFFAVLVESVFPVGHAWRTRQHDFPFTAPGFALEVACPWCTGGCLTCRGRAWSEIGAGGLLSEDLLLVGGYDPELMQGVSFGCSVERLLQLRHGLDDIRPLLKNDPELLVRLERPFCAPVTGSRS